MSSLSKYRASVLKHNRAVKHLDELREEVQTYTREKPLTLSWESIPWQDEYKEKVHSKDAKLIGLIPRVRVPIPEILAPIIGDVVHNLRSALEIMIFDLIAKHLPEDKHRKIEFPFWRCEHSKEKALKFLDDFPEIRSLIEAWEPYPKGRSRLYVLHDMWNLDKHRSVIPMLGGIEYGEGLALFGHSLDGDQIVDPFPARKQVRDGQPYILMVAGLDAPPLGSNVPCEVRLALDGNDEVKGRGLLEELEAHCNVVGAVLDNFARGEAPTFVPPPPPGPVQVGPHQWAFPPSMTPQDVEDWIRKNWMYGDGVASRSPT
jgi:hypothetical protein